MASVVFICRCGGRYAQLAELLRCNHARVTKEAHHDMTFPHFHRFGRVDWGIDGHCRCGMAKRRMFGGYGYAMPGQRWYDRPTKEAQP